MVSTVESLFLPTSKIRHTAMIATITVGDDDMSVRISADDQYKTFHYNRNSKLDILVAITLQCIALKNT